MNASDQPDINSIVRKVIAQLRSAGGPVSGQGYAGRNGIFATVDEAVSAGDRSFCSA